MQAGHPRYNRSTPTSDSLLSQEWLRSHGRRFRLLWYASLRIREAADPAVNSPPAHCDRSTARPAVVELRSGAITTRNRRDNEERLGFVHDCVGQRGIRWFMGKVLRAGEESQERPALVGDVITDRS